MSSIKSRAGHLDELRRTIADGETALRRSRQTLERVRRVLAAIRDEQEQPEPGSGGRSGGETSRRGTARSKR